MVNTKEKVRNGKNGVKTKGRLRKGKIYTKVRNIKKQSEMGETSKNNELQGAK